MMQGRDWSASVTALIAEAVRHFRTERGMSAQQLADACAGLGRPISRNVLANLESGRRASVDLTELLALAKALNVHPAALLVPVGRAAAVEILPCQVMPTDVALEWLTGETMPGDAPGKGSAGERLEEGSTDTVKPSTPC